MSTAYDVAIIGGGVMGCAAAFFLKSAGVDRICVIEPDPTYARAATPVATGGCRRLFALPENIRMSQFSIGFFKDFARHVAVDGHAPDVQWRSGATSSSPGPCTQRCPGRLDNFYVACGFSGHGLMHAPAVGRALAELVVNGRFETLDLSRMGYQRVLDGKPYREKGIL